MAGHRTASWALVLAALLPGCAGAGAERAMQRVSAEPGALVALPSPPTGGSPPPQMTTAVPASPAAPPPATTPSPPLPAVSVPAPVSDPPPSTPTTLAPPPAPSRSIVEQDWSPFATVGGITLVHPSTRVERVGFHQSNHEGARQLDPLATTVAPVVLESRNRETAARTAADVVVDPVAEIRSPVSGRVLRAGTYVLYCEYSDDYLVVEPDAHPGWEVKLLHIDGVRMRPGDRVVAGETVVAGRATQLPFESQVDEVGGFDPAWPHVHIEVIDPTIPDLPSPGGGCD